MLICQRYCLAIFLWAILHLMGTEFILGQESSTKAEFASKFRNHYTKVTKDLLDTYGKDTTAVWVASWDLKTEQYPFNFTRPDSIPNRVYLNRFIDAPAGATLYWNLPDLAACLDLSDATGDARLGEAALAYASTYLDRCTNRDGIILWGNHYYYHVLMDTVVRFGSSDHPRPVNMAEEQGHLHEMRPLNPPWEMLYKWFPTGIERHLRQSVAQHLVNSNGEFNRHANNRSEYAFIEAGSILIHALSFLYSKSGDASLLDSADLILNFSFGFRDSTTGLMANSPSKDRWDKYASTTEIGLWSLNILKSLPYLPDSLATRWLDQVEIALQPWLIHGFDQERQRFFGALSLSDATAIQKEDNYPYKPDNYADIWHPLFPRHDYPLQFAECCLRLYELTSKDIYRMAAQRWYAAIKSQMDERFHRLRYAENYARIIHYLDKYALLFSDMEAKERAQWLAKEAVDLLYDERKKMFRSHTGEHRYDCVDGVGLLYFALAPIADGQLADAFF